MTQEHTSRGDEGPPLQSSLSQLELRDQVEGEEQVIRFPLLLLSWESGGVVTNEGDSETGEESEEE